MSRKPLSYAKSAFRDVPVAVMVRQGVVWLGLVLVALLSAPGDHSGWKMFWLLMTGVLAALSLTGIHLARANDEPRTALTILSAAALAGMAALLISMILRPLSGLLLLVALTLLIITGKNRPFVTLALSVILAPWWVWLALGVWHWQLIMLAPLISLGMIAVSHLLDTHAWPESEVRILPARAHRWAAWLVMTLSGIVLMLAGLTTDVSRPLLALAGIVLALGIPLEAGFGSNSGSSARTSIRIVASAYLIAAASWLVGIA